MFKKNLLLLCALTAAYAPMAVADDVADVKGKCKKCCNCASLNVTGNSSLGGSLSVAGAITAGGSVTANSFITPSGALFNGLRNYAVLSNGSLITAGSTDALVPWSTTLPASVSAGITNAAGVITLPTGGIFLVMYTVRVAIAAGAAGSAAAQLQQTTASVFGNIAQSAIVFNDDTLAAGTDIDTQISGYAIITTTAATNNQLQLLVSLTADFSVPATSNPDANAQLTILQLN
jgi:hypothetical protein